MAKLSFVIVAPEPYSRRWGGVCALYQLADAMQRRGEAVAVLIEPNRKKRGSLPIDPGIVAILPEIYAYEPTGSKNVVRWLLNRPALSGTGDGFKPSDLLFLWSEAYRSKVPGEDCGLLFTSDWRRDIFRDRCVARGGTCYLVRKGSHKPRDQHPSDALCIDDYLDRGGDQYLADVFNRHERFISYDHATMLSTIAAMCGCESVIIPDGVRTAVEAVRDDVLGLAGVAWGFDDLARGHATRLHLPYRLDEWDQLIGRVDRAVHWGLLRAVFSLPPVRRKGPAVLRRIG